MLVFVVGYLAIFILLMGLLPVLAPNLLYGGKDYQQSFVVPDYFDKSDIENIKYFINQTIEQGTTTTYDFTEQINFKFKIKWYEEWLGDNIEPQHVLFQILFAIFIDQMNIENYGFTLSLNEALLNWDIDKNASVFHPVYCDHITIKIWLLDNNKTRNDLTKGWNEDEELELGIGFGFDDVATGYSAFNLIGLLLTFQAPQIFGASGLIAFTLNLIANSPIYLSIAYLVFYFVTSIIPFIRGA